jgi:hypothetical protein
VRIIAALLVATSPLVLSLSLSAQARATPGDQLLDVLVWGAHMPIDPAAYPAALKAEVDRYLRRSNAYHSTRTAPDSLEMIKLHDEQVSYERRLVAVTAGINDAAAASLAAAYVDGLQPCYEWEGYHDCPETEALFADQYQAAHPRGPFSQYLPLLSAHRWLCVAEAYEYEKRPADAARSRAAYEARIKTARASSVVIIRTAADRLASRGRCFSPA